MLKTNLIVIGVVLLGIGALAYVINSNSSLLDVEEKQLIDSKSFDREVSSDLLTIKVGENIIKATVADDEPERIQGLSWTHDLPEDMGKLFIFDKSDYWSIWMKDMNYPIDIIWLDENKEIVFIKENADPTSYPELFKPASPALYVLEINAGKTRELGMEVGGRLDF